MAETLKHPDIGEIKGSVDDGTVKYLGIQFAELKDRIAPPELKTKYDSPINATDFGPASAGPSFGYGLEQGFIQYELPRPPVPHSDLECLNLNVVVPAGVSANAKLPVFVWVHGGGFVNGSNHWPTYHLSSFVKLSAEAGTPVIGVAINYRLGISGLITSEELRSQGYKANNSLRDQRIAFKWVQKYIAGFGGDPNNVTALGESIGGVTVALQLYSKEPLFNRAALLGGSSLLFNPTPLAFHDGVYENILDALKLKDKSKEERLKGLQTIPNDQLWSDVPLSVGFGLAVDGDTIPEVPDFDTISGKNGKLSSSVPGRQWCKELLLSDCQFDGSAMLVLLAHLKNGAAKKFTKSITEGLSQFPGAAQKIFSGYGITDPNEDDESAFHKIIRFHTDIGFHSPSIAFAQGWSGHSYVSLFNEGNPWEGAAKGEATHVLDVVFLFQNYNKLLPPAQAASAQKFGKDILTYISGKAPWKAYTPETPGAQVYGPSSHDKNVKEPNIKYVKSITEEGSGRRSLISELGQEVGYDNLAKAWRGFQTS